jgi:putative endonuclease
MYYTYVLLSQKDYHMYTGFSNDLKRRPFTLMYYEACIDEDDAKARETYLKNDPGKRFLKSSIFLAK